MAVFHSYVSLPEGSFHGILEMVFMVMVCYGECEETCIFETIEVNGETSEMNYSWSVACKNLSKNLC